MNYLEKAKKLYGGKTILILGLGLNQGGVGAAKFFASAGSQVKITDLKISGNDVMEILKLKPGPKVGEVLQKLFDQVVEEKIKNERQILLDQVTIID